jgi:K+ transporter
VWKPVENLVLHRQGIDCFDSTHSGHVGMAGSLFAFMLHNAERSAAYFRIPAAQVVETGIEIEI